jgi:transcriptional regulator with XRE-family HTH domain
VVTELVLTMHTTFAQTLNRLRKERGLTNEQLAKAARVPSTLISGLQNNNRTIGENNAARIGKALGLFGDTLRDFVFLALNEARGKVLEEYRTYPAEVINLVAIGLQAAGISANEISHCDLHPVSKNRNNDADALLYLNNGKTASINVEVITQ